MTRSSRGFSWRAVWPLALILAVVSAPVAAQEHAPPGTPRTFSRWTSITPDPRQFAGQPGGVLPLAVIGNPTFETGDYMIYVGPSNPNGMTLSRWNTFGPYTLKGHDKMSVTMTLESKRPVEPKLTVETNSAELLQYSDPGPRHAMIYVRNTDVSSWQSICVLPVGWNARDRCFGGSNNVRYVPESDNRPVAWWHANAKANDSVGGANGLLEGVSFALGKVGWAFQFSGTTSSVRVPDTPSLDITNNWTLAAWVYTTRLSGHKGGAQGVVSKVGGGGGNYGYQFGIWDGGGEVFLQFNQAGERWPALSLKAGKVRLNTWTCIAGSYDNNTMAIHVDGVLAGSKIVGAKSVANSSSSFRIGLDDNGNVDFSGMIDEVRVYDHALSGDEIRSLCSATAAIQR